MKKSLIFLVFIILSANSFSQDMFFAPKIEFNIPFASQPVNYLNYGLEPVSLRDFSYGLMFRKHIFANFHLVTAIENKHSNLGYDFYDTENLDSSLIINTTTFQGGLGLEYVFYGTEAVKFFVAGHVLYSNTYSTKQKIKIKTFTGTSTNSMSGEEEDSYDYNYIEMDNTLSGVLYKLNYSEITPALEIGFRIKSSFFIEPSVVIKPAYNQFILPEPNRVYFMFNLKIGNVF